MSVFTRTVTNRREKTKAVEVQDSAYPYHDWNERITAECYAPNAAARVLDEHQHIARLVNNYASMSFNFGPTLLSWLDTNAPRVYRSILDGDRLSAGKFSGHGSALAQVYNHMILPLANRRDKVTQVRWGLADFQRRFGRTPEGMWLPETSVDTETLEVLAGRCKIPYMRLIQSYQEWRLEAEKGNPVAEGWLSVLTAVSDKVGMKFA
jgi:alpha-amylase/alpha-mannosidase (GH57 family)